MPAMPSLTHQRRRRAGHLIEKPLGRPAGRPAGATRTLILDEAEGLFAESGYEATSLRDIAARCDVQPAVISYHFGTKAEVFDAVVFRRAAVLNEARSRSLTDALAERSGRPVPLELLIRYYVAPFVDWTRHGDPGWRNYATLMGRLANSPRGVDVIARVSDDIARTYLAEFARTLPDLSRESLVDGFLYMVSAMLFVSARTGRWERLVPKSPSVLRDTDEILANLIPFVAGGFKSLVSAARRANA